MGTTLLPRSAAAAASRLFFLAGCGLLALASASTVLQVALNPASPPPAGSPYEAVIPALESRPTMLFPGLTLSTIDAKREMFGSGSVALEIAGNYVPGDRLFGAHEDDGDDGHYQLVDYVWAPHLRTLTLSWPGGRWFNPLLIQGALQGVRYVANSSDPTAAGAAPNRTLVLSVTADDGGGPTTVTSKLLIQLGGANDPPDLWYADPASSSPAASSFSLAPASDDDAEEGLVWFTEPGVTLLSNASSAAGTPALPFTSVSIADVDDLLMSAAGVWITAETCAVDQDVLSVNYTAAAVAAAARNASEVVRGASGAVNLTATAAALAAAVGARYYAGPPIPASASPLLPLARSAAGADPCLLALSGTASTAAYEALLEAVGYTNTNGLAPATSPPRRVVARVWDASVSQPGGNAPSGPIIAGIGVRATNNEPVWAFLPAGAGAAAAATGSATGYATMGIVGGSSSVAPLRTLASPADAAHASVRHTEGARLPTLLMPAPAWRLPGAAAGAASTFPAVAANASSPAPLPPSSAPGGGWELGVYDPDDTACEAAEAVFVGGYAFGEDGLWLSGAGAGGAAATLPATGSNASATAGQPLTWSPAPLEGAPLVSAGAGGVPVSLQWAWDPLGSSASSPVATAAAATAPAGVLLLRPAPVGSDGGSHSTPAPAVSCTAFLRALAGLAYGNTAAPGSAALGPRRVAVTLRDHRAGMSDVQRPRWIVAPSPLLTLEVVVAPKVLPPVIVFPPGDGELGPGRHPPCHVADGAAAGAPVLDCSVVLRRPLGRGVSAVSYALAGGSGASAFVIDAATGAVKVGGARLNASAVAPGGASGGVTLLTLNATATMTVRDADTGANTTLTSWRAFSVRVYATTTRPTITGPVLANVPLEDTSDPAVTAEGPLATTSQLTLIHGTPGVVACADLSAYASLPALASAPAGARWRYAAQQLRFAVRWVPNPSSAGGAASAPPFSLWGAGSGPAMDSLRADSSGPGAPALTGITNGSFGLNTPALQAHFAGWGPLRWGMRPSSAGAGASVSLAPSTPLTPRSPNLPGTDPAAVDALLAAGFAVNGTVPAAATTYCLRGVPVYGPDYALRARADDAWAPVSPPATGFTLRLFAWTAATAEAFGADQTAAVEAATSGAEADAAIASLLNALPPELVATSDVPVRVEVAGCTDPAAAYVPCYRPQLLSDAPDAVLALSPVDDGEAAAALGARLDGWGRLDVHRLAAVSGVPDAATAAALPTSSQSRWGWLPCANLCEDGNEDGVCDNTCSGELVAGSSGLAPAATVADGRRRPCAGSLHLNASAANPAGNYNPAATLSRRVCAYPPRPQRTRFSLPLPSDRGTHLGYSVASFGSAAGSLTGPGLAGHKDDAPGTSPVLSSASQRQLVVLPPASVGDSSPGWAATVAGAAAAGTAAARRGALTLDVPTGATDALLASAAPGLVAAYNASADAPQSWELDLTLAVTRATWPGRVPRPAFEGAADGGADPLIDRDLLFRLSPPALAFPVYAAPQLCIWAGAAPPGLAPVLFTADQADPREAPAVLSPPAPGLTYTSNGALGGVGGSLSSAATVALPPPPGTRRLLATRARRLAAASFPDTTTATGTASAASGTWLPPSGYTQWQRLPVLSYDATTGQVCSQLRRLPGLVTVAWVTADPSSGGKEAASASSSGAGTLAQLSPPFPTTEHADVVHVLTTGSSANASSAPAPAWPEGLTPYAGRVFLSAVGDAASSAQGLLTGRELWSLPVTTASSTASSGDAADGALALHAADPAHFSAAASLLHAVAPSHLAVAGHHLFFAGNDPDGGTGRELWAYNAFDTSAAEVPAPTLAADLWPGAGSSSPRGLTPFRGGLVFVAELPDVYNNTATGPGARYGARTAVWAIRPRGDASLPLPPSNGIGDGGDAGGPTTDSFLSGGASERTGGFNDGVSGAEAWGGLTSGSGDQVVPGSGLPLRRRTPLRGPAALSPPRTIDALSGWRPAPGARGAYMAPDRLVSCSLRSGWVPGRPFPPGKGLGTDPVTGYDTADYSAIFGAGVTSLRLARDPATGWIGGDPTGSAPVSGPDDEDDELTMLFFTANNEGSLLVPDAGRELWAWSPAAASSGAAPVRVTDLALGPASSDPADGICGYGSLIFTAASPARGRELWAFNLVTRLAYPLLDVVPGAGSGVPAPASSGAALALFKGRLFFVGHASAVDASAALGTTALLQSVLTPSYPSAGGGVAPAGVVLSATLPTLVDARPAPAWLTIYNARLFYACSDASAGRELCATDGTQPPAIIADVLAGTASSSPRGLLAAGPDLLFVAAADANATTARVYSFRAPAPASLGCASAVGPFFGNATSLSEGGLRTQLGSTQCSLKLRGADVAPGDNFGSAVALDRGTLYSAPAAIHPYAAGDAAAGTGHVAALWPFVLSTGTPPGRSSPKSRPSHYVTYTVDGSVLYVPPVETSSGLSEADLADAADSGTPLGMGGVKLGALGGAVLAVGAPGASNGTGAVYVFTPVSLLASGAAQGTAGPGSAAWATGVTTGTGGEDGTNAEAPAHGYVLAATLAPSTEDGASGGGFGGAVAADGTVVVVGAPDAAGGAGGAAIFAFSDADRERAGVSAGSGTPETGYGGSNPARLPVTGAAAAASTAVTGGIQTLLTGEWRRQVWLPPPAPPTPLVAESFPSTAGFVRVAVTNGSLAPTTGSHPGASFGASVAAFADVVVVGAPGTDLALTFNASAGGYATSDADAKLYGAGAAFVFVRDHDPAVSTGRDSWSLTQILTPLSSTALAAKAERPSNAVGYNYPFSPASATASFAGAGFGCAVAADYGLIAVSACGVDGGAGAVYLFTWDTVNKRWVNTPSTTITPDVAVSGTNGSVVHTRPANATSTNPWAGVKLGASLSLHGLYLGIGMPGLTVETRAAGNASGPVVARSQGGAVLAVLDGASGIPSRLSLHLPAAKPVTAASSASTTPPSLAWGSAVGAAAYPATLILASSDPDATLGGSGGAAAVFEGGDRPPLMWARNPSFSPMLAAGPPLQPLDAAPADLFGAAVAVSGAVAAFGAPGDDGGAGSVYVTACPSAPCCAAQGAFTARMCTAGHDRACGRCSSGRCPAGTWEAAVCTTFSDRVCVPCSSAASCPPGTVQLKPCSATADRVCGPLPASATTPRNATSGEDEDALGADALPTRGCLEAGLCPGLPPLRALLPVGSSQRPAAGETRIARVQYAQLVELYNATAGQKWKASAQWGPLIERGVDPCTGRAGVENTQTTPASTGWPGVSCDEGGNVVSIALAGAGLTGPLPSTWGYALPRLERLDLHDNRLTGTVPSALGGLPALTVLDLSSNLLEGRLPPALTGLTRIAHVGVSGNPRLYVHPDQIRRLAADVAAARAASLAATAESERRGVTVIDSTGSAAPTHMPRIDLDATADGSGAIVAEPGTVVRGGGGPTADLPSGPGATGYTLSRALAADPSSPYPADDPSYLYEPAIEAAIADQAANAKVLHALADRGVYVDA